MTVDAGAPQGERVEGRVWTVRLDPHGRPSPGTVRLSCSRPACPDRRLPDTAAGRKAAVAHINGHLARIREGGGPHGQAWCACRSAGCAWHTADPDTAPGAARNGRARSAAGDVRCGGPVVLTVYADRAGRLWRIAEMCARCAAATPDCRVLATASPSPRPAAGPAQDGPAAAGGEAGRLAGETAAGTAARMFSDHGPSGAGPAAVPRARGASPANRPPRLKARRRAKIAQRVVPPDLQPEELRVELVELGDAFRAYQRRPEPELTVLARLHERKARAFASWADVTGDASLRREAERAQQAAQTTLEMRDSNIVRPAEEGEDGEKPAITRWLTRGQAELARNVLDHVQAHAPGSDAPERLAALMLTLRAARAGTGNLTGQDLTGWLQDDAEQVLQNMVDAGWLRLPGSIAEALASRSEDPTTFTVPALLPEGPHSLTLGKNARPRVSGWAQKVVGDRKIRKKKLGAATRLLAVYLTAHTCPDGRLGRGATDGLPLDEIAAFCTLPPADIPDHADLLVTANWLTEADVSADHLHGSLTDRALPLGGLL